MASWLAIPPKSPFSLANLPFGVISTVADGQPHVAVAIGDHALDLHVFAAHDGFAPCAALTPAQRAVFFDPTLNRFAALGRPLHRAVRHYLQALFRAAPDPPALAAVLRDHAALRAAALLPLARVARYHLPLAVGDYTDFFAGRHHARAVGALFRGPAHALHPNYHHVPVAYHGRASSVVVSGTPLHRPRGQVLRRGAGADDDDDGPVFAPCAKLDFELELGMFVARGNELGRPVAVGRAEEHIFGFVLLNDWSARDVQTWEYVPLGPFNAKNFGTSVSPWVVLADALEPFKTAGLDNPVVLQDYLREERRDNVLDIKLEVTLTTAQGNSGVITRTSSKHLLWSWPQMLAHHTVTGCNLRTGDLFGSGTISGPDPGTQGCLLEQTRGGTAPIALPGGELRAFVEDGDTVTITGYAGSLDDDDNDGGGVVGFGECRCTILPCVVQEG